MSTAATGLSPFPPAPAGWVDVDLHGLAVLTGWSYYTLRDRVTEKRIPCNRIGRYRGVRFTWEQVCQIRRMFEQRPADEPAVPVADLRDAARVHRAVEKLRRATT